MKKSPLVILISSFALTACYSSGGGGGSVAIPKVDQGSPNTQKQNNGSPQGKNDNNATSSKFFTAVNSAFGNKESTSLSGVILTANKDGSFKAANPKNNDSLDTLNIDGTTISLFSAGEKLSDIGVNKLKTLSEKDLKDSPNNKLFGYVGSIGQYGDRGLDFKAIRYGVAIVDDVAHPFVQGFLTPETGNVVVQGEQYFPIPHQGSFKYTGFAVYGSGSDYKQLNSEVIADFTNKKVKVDLMGDLTKLTFGGDIHGNTFSGTSKDGIETKGAFYGSLARDVGGVFNHTKEGKNGAFGASNKLSSNTNVTEF
ncbi:transferrin-binding protein-like solute binding protein [Actinobacillus genomosp. 1]|uniref:transferrin-binding protein-like solute binding protein n=1 Tax=Actinobacillus genomosp. 1 TaxID=254839 RepID=UPI002441E43B|nr:transferrin-binding protein-like solute binding protein [Actinobacillus genomosp. 1]WGE33895.1 transferrin-binding protein-like solute binding protein [Actinobacillus genomosp. 1]